MNKLLDNSQNSFSYLYKPEDSIIYLTNNKQSKIDNIIYIDIINASFQKEIISFFPEIAKKNNLDVIDEGDYDDSLDEKSNQKHIPQEFYSKSSLHSTSNTAYFNKDNDEEIQIHFLDTSSSSTDEEEHSSDYDISNRFNVSFLNVTKQNLISPTRIILGDEQRTTILIKNIPTNYYPKDLLSELLTNNDIKGKFNFFYLPFNNRKNENYGFSIINFVNPFHVILFYELYHKKKFSKYITAKSLEISYINYNNTKRIEIVEDNNEILLPLKYLSLFKRIYHHSVCIVKERNFCNEGMFRVKSLGKK